MGPNQHYSRTSVSGSLILSLARQSRVSATALWKTCTKVFDFCKICVGSIIKFKNDAGRSQNEKIEPWGEQNWARRYQKGAKRIRKRTRREPKDSPKGAKGWLKCINRSTFGTNREKGAKRVASDTWKWEPFWDYLPSKMPLEINTKVDGEKVWKFMRKCFQNHVKTRPKINDNSMNSWKLRFLVFCEEYNVKIVFSHDQGSQKSIKNQ